MADREYTLKAVEAEVRELQRQCELKERFAGYRFVSISQWVRIRMAAAARAALGVRSEGE